MWIGPPYSYLRRIEPDEVESRRRRMQMHPNMLEIVVQQHIKDLHREAAARRLARTGRKDRSHRRKAAALRLQRAPAG
jgi:hypothetical protein